MRSLTVLAALLASLGLSACDAFGDDDGEFDLSLTGDVAGTYSGDASYGVFGADGGRVRLRVNDSDDAAVGSRVYLDWTGNGAPSIGAHGVFDSRRPVSERPADVFLVQVVIESDAPDVRLDGVSGVVEVEAAGSEVRGSATFEAVDSDGGSVSTSGEVSFRAVPE